MAFGDGRIRDGSSDLKAASSTHLVWSSLELGHTGLSGLAFSRTRSGFGCRGHNPSANLPLLGWNHGP